MSKSSHNPAMVTYNYVFKFDDGTEKEFKVQLEKETLSLVRQQGERQPDWTRLQYHKCPHCPLDPEKCHYCPIAENITELIDFFKDIISYEEADIYIETLERSYFKRAAVQKGVSSLIGIYMVASGCPILDNLRPMVYFHTPFASLDESTFRAVSMYLLRQYFIRKAGGTPDWEMDNLAKLYDDVQLVNRSFKSRLDDVCTKDANLNAVVILSSFATYIKFNIDHQMLIDLEKIFTQISS